MSQLKSIARHLIVLGLRILAKGVLWKYKPKIVAITGSVGKTSTKDLTGLMIAEQFRVRASRGSYNSEFGVPLTILNQVVARSAGDWFRVMKNGLAMIFTRVDYPEILVLEMAADKPGDIGYLVRLARPDVAVLTNVRGVHLEFYPNVQAIAEEKSQVVRRLKQDGVAIVNFDDPKTKAMKAYAPGRTITYGFDREANIYVTEIKHEPRGQRATLHFRERPGAKPKTYELKTALLGEHQLYAIMAAFGSAVSLGVDPVAALNSIQGVSAPPGRLRVLAGKGGLTILDDTYNSSPIAALAALEVLYRAKKPHRAVLGDMKELGPESVDGHKTVGEVAGKFLHELVVVGDEAAHIAESAKRAGMKPEKIHFAPNADEAAKLVNQDRKGGTVLVKASQALYLERTVKALLKDPRDARRLIQRLKDPAHQVKIR